MLKMTWNKTLRRIALPLVAVLLSAYSVLACAEIVDDVLLKKDVNGEVDAIIKFTVPIQYIRHFPEQKSADLVIYFNVLGSVPRDQWQNYESHRSPPSDLIVGFTVTTRDLNTGPKVVIKFNRPVLFSVSPGKNNQVLSLHIKPDVAQAKAEGSSPVQLPAVSTPAPLAGATRVQPAAAAATNTPSTPATAKPVNAPQIGGKDGLPPFPVIEQIAQPVATSQPVEALTLADQVNRTDAQASQLMIKGRDSLLAGEMFAAIEAFNNVLKLPPNRYSQDAQIWIGISKERAGQSAKARLEYESYLKLYPEGTQINWVKARLAKLNTVLPSAPKIVAAKPQPTNFQTTKYGSLSMYYYHGASHTDTVANAGSINGPTSLTLTDQSTLISNVNATLRSYNNQFDNRLVFQDLYAANLLPGQKSQNRLNSAFYEIRNRVDNYSARIGRQSALGGGVLGRFDGIAAGYGFTPGWRATVETGQLSDFTADSKPVFISGGLEFGVNSPLGGSLYAINQRADGLLDRRAVGGNVRYFEQGMSALAMLDYDLQFQALNMLTLQGTLNSTSGTDYNFLLDRRRSPNFSLRNAVSGTSATVNSLLQEGWTTEDLIGLAKQRTAISNMAQFGITNHIRERWQLGTDITVSNMTGLAESGTMLEDGTVGLEGYVPAMPSTGNTWTLSERLSGNDVLLKDDLSTCSLSFFRSRSVSGKTLSFNGHKNVRELWTVDGTLRFYWQNDNQGGNETITTPIIKVGYKLREKLTVETEAGIDWTKNTSTFFQSSKSTRNYFSIGFRLDY